MRGTIEGLLSPYPLSTLLPAVMQEDEFAVRLTAGLDDVLAPAISALDCLEAYIDPMLAPEDFLHWLATWFGELLDENWPIERQRRAVNQALSMHRLRGTNAGLQAQLELASGGRVEIQDSGGASWSAMPNADLPGEAVPRIHVQVIVDDLTKVSVSAVDELVRSSKPAHVAHSVEVIEQ